MCFYLNPNLAACSHWKNRNKALMMMSTATVTLTWHFRRYTKNSGNSKWFWSRLIRSFDVIWWFSVVFWIHSLIHIFPLLISMSGRAMLYLQDRVIFHATYHWKTSTTYWSLPSTSYSMACVTEHHQVMYFHYTAQITLWN